MKVEGGNGNTLLRPSVNHTHLQSTLEIKLLNELLPHFQDMFTLMKAQCEKFLRTLWEKLLPW